MTPEGGRGEPASCAQARLGTGPGREAGTTRAPEDAAGAGVEPAPHWVAPLFTLLAAGLVPWIVFLGATLPARNTSKHYNLAWVGFDVGLFVALGLTGWFAARRSRWVEVSATAAATLLVTDAWFDVTTSSGGSALLIALVEAVFVEVPLAALSLWIARHAEEMAERTTRLLLFRATAQATPATRAPRTNRRAGPG